MMTMIIRLLFKLSGMCVCVCVCLIVMTMVALLSVVSSASPTYSSHCIKALFILWGRGKRGRDNSITPTLSFTVDDVVVIIVCSVHLYMCICSGTVCFIFTW